MSLIASSDPFGPWLRSSKDERVHCWWCEWAGIMEECRWERVEATQEQKMALAGGDGYEFRCPKCNQFLLARYDRQY